MSQRFSSLVILFLCLSITTALSFIYYRMIEDEEKARFERVSKTVADAVETRIRIYENALIATRGLFNASQNVSREEFRRFVEGFSLHERYPGFKRIGFIRRNAEGKFPIVFMEPQSREGLDSFESDMSAEPTRRAAMKKAEETGKPAASNKTVLIQDTDLGTKPSPGFFIFVPVYHNSPATPRRDTLKGFIFSSFKAQDLFRGLSAEVQGERPRIKISIYDGREINEENLLFTSADSPPTKKRRSIMGNGHRLTNLEIQAAGHIWTAAIRSTPAFEIRSARKPPLILLALGTIISFLIFFVLRFGDKLNEKLTEDLASKKRSEKEILKARKSAEEANKAKSRFLANISHEIRTPLGVITGFTDLALEKAKPTDKVYDYLKTIRRNGEQLATLIGEVLDLSKIEANKLEVEIIRFSLPELLEEIVSSLELRAKEKGVRLLWKKDHPIPEYIKSDPTKLRQILVNLIGNAIKFTNNGEIQIIPRMLSQPERGQLVQMEFVVKDSGIGIPEDCKKYLFQPFAQADNSTTRKYGGTGLGLALSRQLARALCGDIILEESQVGKGSVFCVRITGGNFEEFWRPQNSRAAKAFAPTIEEIKDHSLSGKHILLAEDSADIQALVSLYLRDSGAEVDVASDGLEAVSKATTGSYDIILMDIQMPKMDGHHATEELRKNGFEKPIVALTAHAFKEERDRALRGGFNSYLTKPIGRAAIIQKVLEVTATPAQALNL